MTRLMLMTRGLVARFIQKKNWRDRLNTHTHSLRARVAQPNILVVPGVYDALSAFIAEGAGAEAVYLSGASIAYTRAGRPDIGLMDLSDVANVLGNITDRVKLPVIVDADNGFGNALNVQKTVRLLERVGASAIQLEDQTLPKRCGHLAGKRLVSSQEMVGKIRAALDARSNADTLIIARTDAIGVEGVEAALDRAHAYVEAGADVLFIEAIRGEAEMRRANTMFGDKVPMFANIVEGGKTPMLSAAELEALGYRIVIFPGGAVRAIGHTLTRYYRSLIEHGTNAPFASHMFDFLGINGVVGTDEMLELGQRYDADIQLAQVGQGK
jgi:2-methylisocitrate lyase-like PEP mutase family enzyme